MENLVKKITTVLVAAVMLLSLFTVQADATSSVIISSKDKIKGGDTFLVTVTYNGSDIGRVDAGLSYDTNKLAYISGGTSTGNSGYVDLSLAGTGEAITFNIKFQAISDGQTTVNVETYEMYNLDERYMSETPSASKTINISGDAAAADIIEQETSPEEPEEPTALMGVDELEDDSDNSDNNDKGIAWLFIVVAVVLVALIILIIVILNRKNKKR